MIRDGRRLHFERKSMPGSKRHVLDPIMQTAGIGAGISDILAPAITGAGLGALTAGLTRGNIGIGALVGGGIGALGGATGATQWLGNQLGLPGFGGDGMTYASAADAAQAAANNAFNAQAPGGAGLTSGLLDANGNPLVVPPVAPALDANGNPISGSLSTTPPTGAASGAAAPVANQGVAAARGLGGINNTSLALGVLAALESALSRRPPVGNYNITPSTYSGLPSAANNPNVGPLWNAPSVNTNVPGRQAVTPNVPNWYTYGLMPEQQFFAGNTLQNFGFAEGGALDHRYIHDGDYFSTERGDHFVRGPGTGQSDSVEARLSDGEYVLTKSDVERIGGGSNERGARILDRDRGALARALGEKKFTRQKLKKPDRRAA